MRKRNNIYPGGSIAQAGLDLCKEPLAQAPNLSAFGTKEEYTLSSVVHKVVIVPLGNVTNFPTENRF